MIGLLRDYVRSFIVLDMPKFLDLLPILEKNCFELTKLSKMKIAGTLDHILTECIEATLAGTEMDFRNQLITEQLGFYDTAHFSNFFKKKTSMSPKQYREYKRLLL
ncbi:hypothetical protein ACFQ88_04835 [Paenibacillus sp. NPDC056579]|uniref:hypothetical protein n=1 Tax=Paenibacillus sp. NPDC056579 TaxID=3345871 RepID=UPI0036BCD2DA